CQGDGERAEDRQEHRSHALRPEVSFDHLRYHCRIDQREFAIESSDRLLHGVQRITGITFRAYVQRGRDGEILKHRHINTWPGVFSEARQFAVLCDSYDLYVAVVAEKLELLADCILVRPVARGHRLIDNCHTLGAFSIHLAEVPPFEHRYPQSLEVSQSD